MTTERRQQRQEELYDYITNRPHQPMGLDEIARALGRSPGHQFGLDMSTVRGWAAEDGTCITNCYWDAQLKRYVLVYLPEKQEAMLSVKPLRTQSRNVRTRMRNVGRQAAYTAKNGVRKQDRNYAKLNVKIAGAVESILTAVDEFEQAHDG